MLRFIWCLPLLIPLLVVWLGEYWLSVHLARPFRLQEEMVPRILQSVIASIPFVVAAFYARRRRRANAARAGVLGAVVALLIGSLLLWGLYYADAVFRREGGANIGLGILLLFSPIYLPFLMPLGCRIGTTLARKRSVPGAA